VFQDHESKSLSFPGETDTVRFETEQSLLEGLVDFTDYRNEIRKRVSVNTLPDVTDIHLTVKDVYVNSQFSFQINKQKSPDNVETYLSKWLTEIGQRQIALLGDYGQGKSTTMLMFTYHLLCEKNHLPERIPILIELRGKSPKTLRPLELLGAWAALYRIEPQALMQLHYAGRLVLIFEGFDEMAMVSNVAMRLSHFKTLWQFCYPGAKIVITGRPNFFLDDMEKQKALGIHQPQGNNPFSEAIKLESFTTTQIRAALRKYPAIVCQQIDELAGKNSRFYELISRPSLLHIVADLWEKEKLIEKAESLNSANIMKIFVDRSYRRQGRKEGDAKHFMALNSAERNFFMQGVATYMAAEGLNNQITGEGLNQLIDKLIESIPNSVSTETSVPLGEEQKPLRERLLEPEDYDDIKTDVRACGLLVDDPTASNTFKFGHKSFMEYLFASTVLEYLETPNGSEQSRAIFKATQAQLETLLSLPVSLDFLSELLCIDQDFQQANYSVSDFTKSSDRMQAAIAVKLLTRIIQARHQFTYHFLIFPVVLLASLKNAPFITSTLSAKANNKNNLDIFDKLADFLYNLLNFRKNKSKRKIKLNFIEFVMFVFFVPYVISCLMLASPSILLAAIITPSIKKISNKLFVWNYICKKMGIRDVILHEVVGIDKLPWARNKSFDYFLLKQNKKIKNSSTNFDD
jgi:hypothetical protein